ncbi:MAG: class I SAM-dependent methyltransferase [Candidatus Binatia bacterium]
MQTLECAGPNAEQIRHWNEISGPKWVALHPLIDAQIAPLGRRAMARATPQPGEHVVDVGCGCGTTTLDMARRVGPNGSALGIDVSTVMLEQACAWAQTEGIANIRFENADAQTYAFVPASVDVLFSRFGVMFFADPDAAFTRLCHALRPGGRLAFVCWQAPERNPWLMRPFQAASQYVALPPRPPEGAPGPFALADAHRVRGILSRAGFTGIRFENVQQAVAIGGGVDLDRTVDFLLQMGPTGAALRQAGPKIRPVAARAVRETLLPFLTPQGVYMPAAAWIVTAQRSL